MPSKKKSITKHTFEDNEKITKIVLSEDVVKFIFPKDTPLIMVWCK